MAYLWLAWVPSDGRLPLAIGERSKSLSDRVVVFRHPNLLLPRWISGRAYGKWLILIVDQLKKAKFYARNNDE